MRKRKAIFLVLNLYIISAPLIAQDNSGSDTTSHWQRVGPGGGGATFLPTFSYSGSNRFIVRCDMTGSYYSDDSGASYKQFNFDNGAGCYAFDPNNPNTFYVGSKFLNRTTDNGNTWQKIFPRKENIVSQKYSGDHAELEVETKDANGNINNSGSIHNLRVDPLNSKQLYFSIGEDLYFSNAKTDSFSKISLRNQIEFIYTNKLMKNKLIIFTTSASFEINKSTKEIKNNSFLKEMNPIVSVTGGLTKNNKLIFYAIHQDTTTIRGAYNRADIWLSMDEGKTWKKISDPLITNHNNAAPNFSKIACAEFNAEQAYVTSDLYEEENNGNKNYWFGAIKTGDAGKTWKWVMKAGGGSGKYGQEDGTDAANIHDAWATKAFGKSFTEIEDIGVDPNNGNTAILTDWYRSIKTTDGGKTWKEIYSIKQNDSSYVSRGYDVTTTYGIQFDPFDKNHIVTDYTDIGFHHSYNGGKSWFRSVKGVPDEWQNTCYWVIFDPLVKNKLWSAWSGMHDIPRGKMTRSPNWKKHARGGICVSTDGGKTWTPSNDGLGNDAPTTSMVIDARTPINKRTLYATVFNKGVFKSIDDGRTWQLKNNGILENTCAFKININANGDLFLVVSPTPNYSKNSKNIPFYSGAVYRSTDGAESWQKLNVTDGPLFPNYIVADSAKPGNLFLSCWAAISLSDLLGGKAAHEIGGQQEINMKGGIFFSNDNGNTWKSIFDDKQYVYSVTIDPYHSQRLYCTTFNKAAYMSNDYGTTWQKIKGYDFHWGHTIFPDLHDHEKIYITTYGSGVWHGTPVAE